MPDVTTTADASAGRAQISARTLRTDRWWLPPLLTVIGVDIGYLLGGVVVAEVVFAFPGIGELALVALNARDYPLIQGITIVTASTFVVVNLLIDLLYGRVDPRIRLERS